MLSLSYNMSNFGIHCDEIFLIKFNKFRILVQFYHILNFIKYRYKNIFYYKSNTLTKNSRHKNK